MDININKLINDLVAERVKELIATHFALEINKIVDANMNKIRSQLESMTINIEPETIVTDGGLNKSTPLTADDYINTTTDDDLSTYGINELTMSAKAEIQRTALRSFDQPIDLKPMHKSRFNVFESKMSTRIDDNTTDDLKSITPITDNVLSEFAHNIKELKRINPADIDQHYERIVGTNAKKCCCEDPHDADLVRPQLERLDKTIDKTFKTVELSLKQHVNKFDDKVVITDDRCRRHERLNKEHKADLDSFINTRANVLDELTRDRDDRDDRHPVWDRGTISITTTTGATNSNNIDTKPVVSASISTTADNVASFHDRHFC